SFSRLPPPRSTLFPYTTLFRSQSDAVAAHLRVGRVNRKLNRFAEADAAYSVAGELAATVADIHGAFLSRVGRAIAVQARGNLSRSEEHTSELQSLAYLVCRLLL